MAQILEGILETIQHKVQTYKFQMCHEFISFAGELSIDIEVQTLDGEFTSLCNSNYIMNQEKWQQLYIFIGSKQIKIFSFHPIKCQITQ